MMICAVQNILLISHKIQTPPNLERTPRIVVKRMRFRKELCHFVGGIEVCSTIRSMSKINAELGNFNVKCLNMCTFYVSLSFLQFSHQRAFLQPLLLDTLTTSGRTDGFQLGSRTLGEIAFPVADAMRSELHIYGYPRLERLRHWCVGSKRRQPPRAVRNQHVKIFYQTR